MPISRPGNIATAGVRTGKKEGKVNLSQNTEFNYRFSTLNLLRGHSSNQNLNSCSFTEEQNYKTQAFSASVQCSSTSFMALPP